jgi:4-hydroxy-2-oxoheptanedioate aldolase
MIETEQAVGAVDDILAVGGIDAVYVGPSDLSVSLGLSPGNNDAEPAFAEALTTVVGACERANVVAGIHCTGALTPTRLDSGFGMVTVTTDMVAMRLGLTNEIEAARSGGGGSASTSLY